MVKKVFENGIKYAIIQLNLLSKALNSNVTHKPFYFDYQEAIEFTDR
jgi:hypothetical protein